MKRIKNKLFLLAILFSAFSTPALASVSANLELGYGMYSQESFKTYNLYPKGLNYGFTLEKDLKILSFGGFYKSSSYSGDIISDGIANEVSHKMTSFGLVSKVNITKNLFIHLGVGQAKLNHTIKTSVSTSADNSIRQTYDLQVDGSSGVLEYGVGFKLYTKKKYSWYLKLMKASYSKFNAYEYQSVMGFGLSF